MTFGERLREVRIRKNLTMEELGNLVSVQKMTISKYESDRMMPSSKTLLALCNVLSVDANYFFMERTAQLQTKPVFRSKGKVERQSAHVSDKVTSLTNDAVGPYLEILTVHGLDKKYQENETLRRLVTRASIEVCADNVRKAWGLGLMPVANLTEMLEKHGFCIVNIREGVPGELENCDAASFLDESFGPVIAQCPVKMRTRQRFSLAHEMGHYFVLNTESTGKLWNPESRANLFAAAFLMPAAAVYGLIGRNPQTVTPEDLRFLSKHFGVSFQTTINRLNTLGIISNYTKTRFLSLDEDHAFDNLKDLNADRTPETSDYMTYLVTRAVSDGLISMEKGEELRNQLSSPQSNRGTAAA